MTTLTGKDVSWTLGVPKQHDYDFGVTPSGLVIGETPQQFAEDHPTAFSQTLAAGTIVGFNANKEIIKAVKGTTQAIGILLYPVTTGSSGDKKVARVLRAGAINPLFEGLVWDSSYATRTDKMMAFQGAPSPTQFVTRTLSHGTPVTP